MTVDSYLELFTTLFGWAFYGILWDVLVGTGIVFLPFLGILIDNWREPAEGGEFGTVTGLSLRRMETGAFHCVIGGGPGRATGRADAVELRHAELHTTADLDQPHTYHGNSRRTPEYLRHDRIYGFAGNGEHPGLVVCRAGHDVRFESRGGRRTALCSRYAHL